MNVYLINSRFYHCVRCVELVVCNNEEVKQREGCDVVRCWRREWRVILERGQVSGVLLQTCVRSAHQATE
jgi:hypothetical protein